MLSAICFNLDQSKILSSGNRLNNKILDFSKLYEFANNNSTRPQMIEFLINRVKNILGKVENAGYQHFVTSNFCFFPKCFRKAHSLGSLKSQKRPTRKVFVYKIQVNPIHTILKYGDYYDFMDR